MEKIIDGLKINYQIFGNKNGKSLLILHGWGSNSEKWKNVTDLLIKKNIKVIIPDLPGFGRSQNPPKPWGLNEYRDFVKKFADAMGIENFYLVGHSFGGAVAAKYCVKFPQDIKKIFLVAAACIRRKTIKKWFLSRISKIFKVFSFLPIFPLARKSFYKFIIGGDYQYSEGVMKESFSKVISEDLSTLLNLINIQAIIIWGDKDDATLVSDAYLINKKIKNSKLVILPNLGHSLENENPNILARKILENI